MESGNNVKLDYFCSISVKVGLRYILTFAIFSHVCRSLSLTKHICFLNIYTTNVYHSFQHVFLLVELSNRLKTVLREQQCHLRRTYSRGRLYRKYVWFNSFEPRHEKTKKVSVRPAKTQTSLGSFFFKKKTTTTTTKKKTNKKKKKKRVNSTFGVKFGSEQNCISF